MKLKAIERATIEVDLHLAETAQAEEAEKCRKLEAKLKKADQTISRLKKDLGEARRDLCRQNEFTKKSFRAFANFKEKFMLNLVRTRLTVAKDFQCSASYKFAQECQYDDVRLDGFMSVVGQLSRKALVPEGYNLEENGISIKKDAEGSEIKHHWCYGW